VFAAEPEVAPTDLFTGVVLGGRIELKQVSFRYDARSPLVLNSLDLTIEPGQKVAIVGSSGSGKSTLAMLLLGLYRPTSGEIWYDGVPLSQIDPGDLRRQFGVVMQESFIFRDSIRSNIALNRPDLSLERVKAAAFVAALADDIERLPMRYETQVAERGLALSGGQRQRLAIARAVAGEPRVLLLDEATSHLDVATERRVDRNISELQCTRVVIAHRLSTVRNADAIVVLDQGRICELGSHVDLLAHGGLYADLVEGQSPNDTLQDTYAGALAGRP